MKKSDLPGDPAFLSYAKPLVPEDAYTLQYAYHSDRLSLKLNKAAAAAVDAMIQIVRDLNLTADEVSDFYKLAGSGIMVSGYMAADITRHINEQKEKQSEKGGDA